MLNNRNTEDVYFSIDTLLKSKNKLISTWSFLSDMFDVISIKSIKVSRELLVLIIKLIDDRL